MEKGRNSQNQPNPNEDKDNFWRYEHNEAAVGNRRVTEHEQEASVDEEQDQWDYVDLTAEGETGEQPRTVRPCSNCGFVEGSRKGTAAAGNYRDGNNNADDEASECGSHDAEPDALQELEPAPFPENLAVQEGDAAAGNDETGKKRKCAVDAREKLAKMNGNPFALKQPAPLFNKKVGFSLPQLKEGNPMTNVAMPTIPAGMGFTGSTVDFLEQALMLPLKGTPQVLPKPKASGKRPCPTGNVGNPLKLLKPKKFSKPLLHMHPLDISAKLFPKRRT